MIQRELVSPFKIQTLPLFARLYRRSFRGGLVEKLPYVARMFSRVVFYAMEIFGRKPAYGTFSFKVGQHEKIIRFNARNRQFSALYFATFLPIYEPDVTMLITEFMPSEGVFYDIGSNWGYFSLFLASREDFRGRIHAFEPWPSSYRDLESMVTQAELEKVITHHNLALGESREQVLMQCGRHSGEAKIIDGTKGNIVRQETLDSLQIEGPDFIKIDAEDSELSVLRGGTRILDEKRPSIVFEFNSDNDGSASTDVLIVLEEHQYEVYYPFVSREKGNNYILELLPFSRVSKEQLTSRCNLFASPREQSETLEHYISNSK